MCSCGVSLHRPESVTLDPAIVEFANDLNFEKELQKHIEEWDKAITINTNCYWVDTNSLIDVWSSIHYWFNGSSEYHSWITSERQSDIAANALQNLIDRKNAECDRLKGIAVQKEKEKIHAIREKVNLAENLREKMWNDHEKERMAIAQESKKVFDKLNAKYDKIKQQRLIELDKLERQYVGRIEGEVFQTKKEKLDSKYEDLLGDVLADMRYENYRIDAFMDTLKKEFNKEIAQYGLVFTGRMTDKLGTRMYGYIGGEIEFLGYELIEPYRLRFHNLK